MSTIKINTRMASWVLITIILAVIGFLLYQVYLPKTGYVTNTGSPPEENPLNIFEGKITTKVSLSPERIDGITIYDANCIGQPITECDAGINTKEYGQLNFHYFHDMAIQPCLHMFGPEKVIIEILDSNGDAKIIRTQDFSMVGHHG